MKQTKQQRIEELETKISNMYSVYDYNSMVEKKNRIISALESDLRHSEMCTTATQIQLATYKGMVDIYERITDTKETITENRIDFNTN